MKLRHVRAVAVFGITIVALTGARGGGSCDNSSSGSSGSSSSSSGGGSVDDSTTGGTSGSTSGGSDDTTAGSSSSGGSSISGVTGGGGRKDKVKDVRLTDCKYTDTYGITATIEFNNQSDQTYDYKYKVDLNDPNGTLVRTANLTQPFVTPGSVETYDASASYVAKDGEDVSKVSCKLHSITRTEG